MSEKPEIQQIPIDPDGRYLLVVKGLSSEAFKRIAKRLAEWWESGELAFLLALDSDVEFEFVRVDDDQKPSQG